MGKKKYIETPEKMWQLFKDYVKWSKDNPMYEYVVNTRDGGTYPKPLHIPITFSGFEDYLNDNNIVSDLGHYESNKDGRYNEYVTIIKDIKNKCFVNCFNGASVGLFNANIIARKLGLSDKQELTGKDGGALEVKQIDLTDIKKRI